MGVGLTILASGVNVIVARVLMRAGRKYRSIALEADAQHLLTDVWTSAGVVVGIALVLLTGWHVLDPLIALAVAINIVFIGWRLLRESSPPRGRARRVPRTRNRFSRRAYAASGRSPLRVVSCSGAR